MFKVLGLVCFIILWFGFVGPWMVSAPDDILVGGWFLSTAILGIFGIKFVINKLKGKNQ